MRHQSDFLVLSRNIVVVSLVISLRDERNCPTLNPYFQNSLEKKRYSNFLIGCYF